MLFARKWLLVMVAFTSLPGITSADHPRVELVGSLRISGTDIDASGSSHDLEDGSPADRFGGLSGIEFIGNQPVGAPSPGQRLTKSDATASGRFLLLADRGAGDGAVDYDCRFHEADLSVDVRSKTITMSLVATRLMIGDDGQPLRGSLTRHANDLKAARDGSPTWSSMDPEGVRRLEDGSFLISDEYGPRLAVFDSGGRLRRSIAPTDDFRLVSDVVGQSDRGVCPNRGFEGVAVITGSDNQTRFVCALQSPLLQDGVMKGDKCVGENCRFAAFDAEGNPCEQIVYPLDSQKTGVSEILAIDSDRFLVLERDSKGGLEATHKRIYLVDASEATDVSAIDSLPVDGLPIGVVPMRKRLLIDLLDPTFGIGGDLAGEKPEGLSWGPMLPDGRQTLWVAFDNDFDPQRDTEIHCFALDRDALTMND